MNLLECIKDADLIDELVRRGRVRVIDARQIYFTELASDDKYMDSLEQDVMRLLVKGLNDKLIVAWSDTPADLLPNRTVRSGELHVLLREKDADSDV